LTDTLGCRDTVRLRMIFDRDWPLQGGKKKSAFLETDAGKAEPG